MLDSWNSQLLWALWRAKLVTTHSDDMAAPCRTLLVKRCLAARWSARIKLLSGPIQPAGRSSNSGPPNWAFADGCYMLDALFASGLHFVCLWRQRGLDIGSPFGSLHVCYNIGITAVKCLFKALGSDRYKVVKQCVILAHPLTVMGTKPLTFLWFSSELVATPLDVTHYNFCPT